MGDDDCLHFSPPPPAGAGVTLDNADGRYRVRINAGFKRVFLGK